MNWVFWALLSALFAGITAVLAKKGVENMDSNLATAIRTSVILVLAWLIVLFRWETARPTSITRSGWFFLVSSGLATGLSWLCYFHALKLGPVSRVAPVDKLSVVFAIVFALLFLGEQFKWQQWLGATLIVSGALVLAIKW